jgi:adenine phosphoribosyltransferase
MALKERNVSASNDTIRFTMIDYQKYVVHGKSRADLAPLFRDPLAFNSAIKDMAEPFRSQGITTVAALDALGFVFGSAIAKELDIGLVLVRKGGKLPVDSESISFTDYSGETKSFEIVKGAIQPDDTILIVDEWSSTGAQLKAAISLIERMQGKVAGATCYSMNARVKADPALVAYKLHSLLTSES